MEWLLTPIYLLRNFHRQKSLAGYSPWGHKESDTTEQLTLSLSKVPVEGTMSSHAKMFIANGRNTI